jgi:hypothetical protein
MYDPWRGYEPSKPELFRKAVESLTICCEDFPFVDLGSGKVRALLLASEFPFREIVGIELGPHVQRAAQRNVHRYKTPTQKCNRFRLIEADFTSCALPEGNVLIYLFYPCREPKMRKLVANTSRSAAVREYRTIPSTIVKRHGSAPCPDRDTGVRDLQRARREVEAVFAELKNYLGLRRLRLRRCASAKAGSISVPRRTTQTAGGFLSGKSVPKIATA